VITITAEGVDSHENHGGDASMSESYRDLIAWQKAKKLALEIYVCTQRFPNDEMYGLTQQMRRAAISIPSNIAEGKGRCSHKDLVRFLYHARGSLLELETRVSIAHDLGYIDAAAFKRLEGLMGEEGRILNGLINRFEGQIARCAA
jgi:four helix bundle protein